MVLHSIPYFDKVFILYNLKILIDYSICISKSHRTLANIYYIFKFKCNSEQWPDPETFKPERFDPLSEHYYISEDKKTPRNPFSYIPFSFGVRKCPGMILALTEIKALICYLATKVDYSIDKELLENDNVRFGIYTNFNLILNIDKIR